MQDEITSKNKSIAQFKLLLEYSDEAFLLLDKNLKVLSYSKLFATFLKEFKGKEINEGDSAYDCSFENDKAVLENIFKNVLKGKEEELEAQIKIKYSKSIHLLNKYKPILNAEKQVDFVFISCKDISREVRDRKLIEERDILYKYLAEDEEDLRQNILNTKLTSTELIKYKKVIDQSNSGVCILSMGDKVAYINPYFEKTLGYNNEEVNEINSIAYFFKDKELGAEIQEALMQGNEWRGDISLVSKNKKVFHYNLVAGPIRNDIGETIGIYGIHTDIEERISHEKELQSLNQRFHYVLNSTRDAFCLLDEEARVLYWNKVATKLFGIKKEEIIGEIIWEKFQNFKTSTLFKTFGMVLSNKTAVTYQDYVRHIKSWLEYSVTPVENGVSVFIEDITEAKSQEKLNLLEKEVLELNTRNSISLEEIIEHLLNGIKEVHPDMLCSVLKVKDKQLHNWTSPHLNSKYSEQVKNIPIGYGMGSCGTSSYLKERVIVSDISTSPLWENIKELPLSFGLKACWSYPILDNEQNVIATFAIYYKTKREPVEQELHSIDRARTILKNIIEQRLANEAIQKSNERFNIVERATDEAIFDWDLETGQVYFSRGYEKLFGHVLDSNNELTIDDWRELVHPDDLEAVDASMQKAFDSVDEHYWTAEYRYLKADGTYANALDRVLMIRNDQSRVIRMTGSVQDISKKKRAEEDIIYKSKLLEASSKVASAIIQEADLLDVLKKGFEIIGGAANLDRAYFFERFKNGKEFLNQRIEWSKGTAEAKIDNPEMQNIPVAVVDFYMGKLMKKEAFQAVASDLSNKKAKQFFKARKIKSLLIFPIWIQNIFFGLIGFEDLEEERVYKEDELVFLKTFTSNITSFIEKINFATTIKESQEQFHSLISNMPGITYRCANDANWTMHFISDEIERVTGYPYTDFIENKVRSFRSIIHDEAEDIDAYVRKCLKNKKMFSAEYRLKRADGSLVWIEEKGQGVYDENGELKYIDGVILDISERKKNRDILHRLNKELERKAEELEASNAELEQYAYLASHDLLEPLRMIKSFLIQIEKKYADKLDDTGRKYIQLSVGGAVRMRQIIVNFLEYSSVGKTNQEREWLESEAIFKEIIEFNKLNIKAKKAKLIFQNLPKVYSNPVILHQVLSNLLSNALKYTKTDTIPEIKINCAEKSDHWLFSVEDNGIGIDMKHADKIFILFQRLHHQEKYQGTGIGLAICKRAVERYKGSIWLESEQGKGSTFYFTLPKVEAVQ